MERCDCCSNPAVLHETIMEGGVPIAVHLCEEHAIERGYMRSSSDGSTVVTGKTTGTEPVARPRAARECATCGATMQSILAAGVAGCAGCYTAFEKELGAVVSRAQAGASVHVGRHPAQASGLVDRAALSNRLARELREAIAREEYERAAQLRDRLHALGEDSANAADATAPSQPRAARAESPSTRRDDGGAA